MWEGVQRDWRTAPVDEKLRAALGFVEQLTLRPETVTRSDAQRVLDAGVSREALEDAIVVASLFSMIVRLADALGWDVPGFDQFSARAEQMLATGYTLDD